ncbi:DUF2158 domain-containing protein (plasmid) [Bernardetia sp. Wsw4-3y2]|uniref:DUF2158 domain-containing protein n=1 Tax=Bernardetia sp. Wsw4-3y2 TaxID=3127471 RepID=UPI0030D41611
MNNVNYKVGDVVSLKSGGPLMTIKYVGKSEDSKITCLFYNRDSKSYEELEYLSKEMLQLVKEEDLKKVEKYYSYVDAIADIENNPQKEDWMK